MTFWIYYFMLTCREEENTENNQMHILAEETENISQISTLQKKTFIM